MDRMIKLFESYAIEMTKFVMDDGWKEGWDRSVCGDSVAYDPEELSGYFPDHKKKVGSKGRQFDAVVPILGKLSLIKEAAGNVRVIAIPDAWTQTVLAPMHKVLFKLIRLLPSDATFDQQGSVSSFADLGHKELYSFDLKAATDTIPFILYEILFAPIFGQTIAATWIKLLRDRVWKLPSWTFVKDGKEISYPLSVQEDGVRKYEVSYGRGQPMGALSSWGALALVHHAVVQYSAFLVDKFPYSDYRVLGDDIVISGKDVANSYSRVCANLGIVVGLAKSFSSEKGFFNFANQSYLGSENISPISFKQELASNTGSTRVMAVVAAVAKGWIDIHSNGFFVHCLRYMLPPLYLLQVEASRKLGVVHEVLVSATNLLFRSILSGSLNLKGFSETVSVKVASSGLVNPGLSLLTRGLESLSQVNQVTDWSSRELLGRLIIKQIERIELLIEKRLGDCESVSPQYGYTRFLFPQEVLLRGERIPIWHTLPLLERISEDAEVLVDRIVVGLTTIRVLIEGIRLELPYVIEEGDVIDLGIAYKRLLLLETEVVGAGLSDVAIFNDIKDEDQTESVSLFESVDLALGLQELEAMGVRDHVDFSSSFSQDLLRMQQAVGYAHIVAQTNQQHIHHLGD
jgi:hypothetical protein